jgi:hypothetical protein
METGLSSSIHDIGLLEPAFCVGLVVGLVAAVFIARGLKKLDRTFDDPWRRRVYLPLIWVAAGLSLFAGSILLVHCLYYLLHPDVDLVSVFVWPAFLIPVALMLVLARRKKPVWEGAAGAAGQ